jgi:molybdate transport system substrate-binding protein
MHCQAHRILVVSLLLAISVLVHGTELVVVAPSGVSAAITEVVRSFERSESGSKVRVVSASADTILQHAATGAALDVLLRAGLETMDQAAAQKYLMNDTRRLLLRDRLVLMAPITSTLRLTSLADLLRGDLRRVAVGLPDSVPSRNYARHALEASGLWQALYGKFVFGRSTTENLDRIAHEDVDAGFALLSDANSAVALVRKVLDIDARVALVYPIAVARSSTNEILARRFVDFAGSAEAWEVFDQRGFLRP